MFRNWDWECTKCGVVDDMLVWVESGEKSPSVIVKECEECGEEVEHERRFPLTAPYMGERMSNFDVYGGRFDTMGMSALPKIPDMPGLDEYQAKQQKFVQEMPEMPVKQMEQEMERKFGNDGPTAADFYDHMQKPECKEIAAQREIVKEQNAEKKDRARAIKKGENINMRKDKCKGDPKLME